MGVAPLGAGALIGLLACGGVEMAGSPSDRGLYRVEVLRTPEGVEAALSDPQGRAVTDASVDVTVEGVGAGVADPGECDAVGPDRCSHPGGRYLTRIVLPDGPVVVRIAIDGPAGVDGAERTLTGRPAER